MSVPVPRPTHPLYHWVWKPRYTSGAFAERVHPDYCRWSVHDTGRGVGFHQCGNKAKIEVRGLKFCGRHAKEAEGLCAKGAAK